MGGPVVLRPAAISIQDTKATGRAYLIGIIKSYVPYRDVAVSQRTGNPRVIFEENSGLAAVCIEETIAFARCVMDEREQATKDRVFTLLLLENIFLARASRVAVLNLEYMVVFWMFLWPSQSLAK